MAWCLCHIKLWLHEMQKKNSQLHNYWIHESTEYTATTTGRRQQRWKKQLKNRKVSYKLNAKYSQITFVQVSPQNHNRQQKHFYLILAVYMGITKIFHCKQSLDQNLVSLTSTVLQFLGAFMLAGSNELVHGIWYEEFIPNQLYHKRFDLRWK